MVLTERKAKTERIIALNDVSMFAADLKKRIETSVLEERLIHIHIPKHEIDGINEKLAKWLRALNVLELGAKAKKKNDPGLNTR
jgi:hypothetical protein